jgi:hypothetical protein
MNTKAGASAAKGISEGGNEYGSVLSRYHYCGSFSDLPDIAGC